jgi:hypothetical protein
MLAPFHRTRDVNTINRCRDLFGPEHPKAWGLFFAFLACLVCCQSVGLTPQFLSRSASIGLLMVLSDIALAPARNPGLFLIAQSNARPAYLFTTPACLFFDDVTFLRITSRAFI